VTLLEVRHACRAFGGLRAVDDVSFEVAAGQVKAVIGPNGAGKTTLFNLIAGSIGLDSGALRFDGNDIQGLPPHRIAHLGMSRTYQNVQLFAHMSVLENVMVGRHVQSRAGLLSCVLRLPGCRREEGRIAEKARELLDFLEIGELADADAHGLSFGQQRTVEFARALATDPRLLLLDEPAAGLNIHETERLADLIAMIRDRGITILIVEHDMSLVMGIADEIVVLSSGRKIAEGKPRQIQADAEVVRVYLGEDDA
jgi:branched-chain amino acid transport system ATP-binding protein